MDGSTNKLLKFIVLLLKFALYMWSVLSSLFISPWCPESQGQGEMPYIHFGPKYQQVRDLVC